MEAVSEFLALVREATPDSLVRAERLLPLCASRLDPRRRRMVRRLLEHAASSFRHAIDAGGTAAAYDARGGSVTAAEGPCLAVEA